MQLGRNRVHTVTCLCPQWILKQNILVYYEASFGIVLFLKIKEIPVTFWNIVVANYLMNSQ